MKKVFLVEDDPDQSRIFSMALRLRGYKVDTSFNGADALRVIRGGYRPDIAVVDICLPGESGYRVIKSIRDSGHAKDVPIIAISAATEANITKALKEGANVGYVKPFKISEVLDKVDCRVGD